MQKLFFISILHHQDFVSLSLPSGKQPLFSVCPINTDRQVLLRFLIFQSFFLLKAQKYPFPSFPVFP